MPIYPRVCIECGYSEDILADLDSRDNAVFCPHCGSFMRRALEQQTVMMRGDIEPGFDESLGEYVGSRRELREKLAYRGAYCPDLMQNPEPSAGRLTSEERDIVEGRNVGKYAKKTIFERRKQPGWGGNPSVLNNPDAVTTEGEADYSSTINYIKERSNAARGG